MKRNWIGLVLTWNVWAGCGSGTTDPANAYGDSVLPSPAPTEDEVDFQAALLPPSQAPSGGREKPKTARSGGFFVADGKLYDKYGVEFVMRGVSNPHAWYDGNKQALNALDDISGFGFNLVRIVWEAQGGFGANRLREVIASALAQRLVPMLELHDVTGSTDNADLLGMAEYLTQDEVKAVLVEFEEFLLVNVANEWSGPDWIGGYTAAVEHLRDEGIHHTLVLDANQWGQNADVLFEHGPSLLALDPEHNLMFSTHMYEAFANPDRIKGVFATADDMQLPFLVGEFGHEHGGREIDAGLIIAEAADRMRGTIAWSWFGNSSDVAHLDMASDWNGPLTDWGELVVDGTGGVLDTAVRASFFAD